MLQMVQGYKLEIVTKSVHVLARETHGNLDLSDSMESSRPSFEQFSFQRLFTFGYYFRS